MYELIQDLPYLKKTINLSKWVKPSLSQNQVKVLEQVLARMSIDLSLATSSDLILQTCLIMALAAIEGFVDIHILLPWSMSLDLHARAVSTPMWIVREVTGCEKLYLHPEFFEAVLERGIMRLEMKTTHVRDLVAVDFRF